MEIPDGRFKICAFTKHDGQNGMAVFDSIAKNGEVKVVLEWSRFSPQEQEFPSKYIFLNPLRLQKAQMMGAEYFYQDQVDMDAFERATGSSS